MVTVTQNGVTFEVAEVGQASNMLYNMCQNAAHGIVTVGNFVSHEDFLSRLCNHYRARFPLSSVLVIGVKHTIDGPHFHQHFEQPLNVFGHTRGTEVYVIGRGQGTVITNFGDGGYANWIMDGWFDKQGTTVRFE